MNTIEFNQKFFELEIKFKFYEQKSNGLYYWDIVRHEVYTQIYNTLNGISIPNVKRKKKLDKKKIFEIYKYFRKINKQYDYLFFTSSRNINSEKKYYDILSDHFIEKHDLSKSLIIESYIYEKNKYNVIKDYGLIFSLINPFIRRQNEIFPISEILKNEFQTEININELINRLIYQFKVSHEHYLRILKKIKPKYIVIVQNGIQKSLFGAAKKLNIKCYEIQHGLINLYHPAYSYPKSIKHYDKIYLPYSFLIFSEKWMKNINYPVKKIKVIGYPRIENSFKNNSQKKYDYTFILADVYEKNLFNLYEKLINYKNDLRICIKLHPNQLSKKVHIKSKYKNTSVDIILEEKSIDEIINLSFSIVVIQSTVVYQALDLNCIVYIYKKQNYQIHNDLINNPNVIFFDNMTELTNKKDQKFKSKSEMYFKPLKYKLSEVFQDV